MPFNGAGFAGAGLDAGYVSFDAGVGRFQETVSTYGAPFAGSQSQDVRISLPRGTYRSTKAPGTPVILPEEPPQTRRISGTVLIVAALAVYFLVLRG